VIGWRVVNLHAKGLKGCVSRDTPLAKGKKVNSALDLDLKKT
jgi:hypothetical protein